MATFKAEVYAHQRKQDGTYNIKIRIIHNKKKRYLATTWFVEARDLTRSLKIKNQRFIDYTDELIREYRRRCDEIGPALKDMDIDEVVNHITKNRSSFSLDFIAWGMEQCDEMRQQGRISSAYHYGSAVKSFATYVGGAININSITAQMLTEWAKEIAKTSKGGHKGYEYPSLLSTLYDRAKRHYNDEDMGIILIPYSPFARMVKIPKPAVEKRSITAEQIRKIAALPRSGRIDRLGNLDRRDLALDLFILSFCLIGMNMADLYTCTEYDGNTISYQRKKTRDRRPDKAAISVDVPDEIRHIVDKYRDTTGQRVFNFYKRFKNAQCMTSGINIDLKDIGNSVGVDGLQFYAARHSWATIAVNDVGVDKYTVHAALNHVDREMKITDVYIRRSFKPINEANRKVLDFMKLEISK